MNNASPLQHAVLAADRATERAAVGTATPVAMPVESPPAGGAATANDPMQPPSTLRTRLLLVDDEEGIRTVLGLLLQDMGYNVTLAASGAQALDALAQNAMPLVLSDIKMPGMDGLQLLAAIRTAHPFTETIMLTGHGDMELAVACLRLGAADFLTKPVGDDALAVALQRALERRALRLAVKKHTEELEALVERRTRDLVEAERLAAIGETAAILAHAIKNIAGGLDGAMFVLEKGMELNRADYLQEGWELIRGDVARVRDLAMRLLAFGKPWQTHMVPYLPDAPPHDVATLCAPAATERCIGLHLRNSAPQLPMLMDAEAVRIMLTDLVTNAMESYAQPGSRLTGRNITLATHVATTPEGASTLVYTVADNGPGMHSDVAAQLGQRWLTTKRQGSGFGFMGVRKLVHELGGEIVVHSTPGEGTTVTLRLPTQPATLTP